MADRLAPYGAFNFIVSFDGDDQVFGGFSDISGLSTEMVMAEYRAGNEKQNHVRKIPGLHKVSEVTGKRGIVSSVVLWEWITQTRNEGIKAQRQVSISLLDESHNVVQKWTLSGVVPMKYTGPTLAAKASTDVA